MRTRCPGPHRGVLEHGMPCFRRLLAACLPLLLGLAPTAAQDVSPTPFRVVLLSDFNGPYGATTYPAALGRVMDRVVNEWRPDLLLSAGDVIGGQKLGLTDATRRAMWAAFDRDVAGRLRNAGIPYAFAVGNHDGSAARDRQGRFVFAADRDALAAYWAGDRSSELVRPYYERLGIDPTTLGREG